MLAIPGLHGLSYMCMQMCMAACAPTVFTSWASTFFDIGICIKIFNVVCMICSAKGKELQHFVGYPMKVTVHSHACALRDHGPFNGIVPVQLPDTTRLELSDCPSNGCGRQGCIGAGLVPAPRELPPRHLAEGFRVLQSIEHHHAHFVLVLTYCFIQGVEAANMPTSIQGV